MKRVLLSIAALALLAAARAPTAADVDYGFTAWIADGKLSVRHRILNRSGRALCFFPGSMDIDIARLRGPNGAEIQNIHNSGYVIGRQIVYFAASDGKAHLFSYSAELGDVFRPVENAARVERIEFDFYGFDCNDLTSGRTGLKPLVRKTATAVISRTPSP